MGMLHSIAAELSPDWLKRKENLAMADTRKDADRPPMADPNWKPEVEKTPLDPKDHEDEFDKNRDDGVGKPDDPRGGFTPRP